MSDAKEKFRPTFAESTTWDEDVTSSSNPQTTSRKLERFKGKTGKTHRILIIDEAPIKVLQHYKPGFGYLRCLKSVGKKCAACDRGEVPAQKFGVNVLLYPDNASSGKEVDAANVKVLAWVFGVKTYNELRTIRAEWGEPTTYDIKVACQNEQFQHLAITNCRDRLLETSPDRNRIDAKVIEDKYDLKAKLGRVNSEDQMEGIYAGTLSADELFKKKDNTVGGASTDEVFDFPTSSTPEEVTPGSKLDFDKLLGLD